MKTHKLCLKKDKEFALLRGHPWAFAEAFKEVPQNLKTGDIAEVFSHKDVFIGCGYIDTDSTILVRMVPTNKGENFEKAVARLVKQAASFRKDIFNEPEKTNAYRVINGEGDGLPGLIADYYNGAVSLQIYSLGLLPYIDCIIKALRDSLQNVKWIYQRNEIRLAKTNSAKLVFGKNLPEKIEFKENGLKFTTDLVNGQKTGFFLDQRENRHLIRSISKGKSLLNICGYTGAFTVAAIAGGCKNSVTVDIAKPALEEAEANLRLNDYFNNNHKLVVSDMYDYLAKCKEKSFDIVVLDPPSMAKNRKDHDKAIRAYKKLNLAGVKAVKEGGFLYTASCTSQVSRQDFLNAVKEGVTASGRRAIIVKETFHTYDHPTALAHSEGPYLKGILLKVY